MRKAGPCLFLYAKSLCKDVLILSRSIVIKSGIVIHIMPAICEYFWHYKFLALHCKCDNKMCTPNVVFT